jgi:hypothetical protein
MKKNPVNWWNIIAKLRYDKSIWDYLEPAEIIEIIQRVNEAKKKIKGLEKHINIDLRPAFQKLNSLMHVSNVNLNNYDFFYLTFQQKILSGLTLNESY